MNEIKMQVEYLSNVFKQGGITNPLIEDLLWELVEKAMKVQQQICGGHK